jgi:hypothetical protein
MMLSKKFLTWVGVGVFSVATIPVFAAPILAKQAAHKHPTVSKTTTPVQGKTGTHKTTPAKTPLTTRTSAKKTATKTATKTAAKTPSHLSTRTTAHKKTTPAHKPTTTTHKPAPLAHKPVTATAHKATPTSTAKRLLH